MKKPNAIVEKSFLFAAEILDLNVLIIKEQQYELARQLVRSGTSIGANVRESQRAVSDADFINKLGIALKEAEETGYWLDLVDLKVTPVNGLLKEKLNELIKLLVSIINSTRQRMKVNAGRQKCNP